MSVTCLEHKESIQLNRSFKMIFLPSTKLLGHMFNSVKQWDIIGNYELISMYRPGMCQDNVRETIAPFVLVSHAATFFLTDPYVCKWRCVEIFFTPRRNISSRVLCIQNIEQLDCSLGFLSARLLAVVMERSPVLGVRGVTEVPRAMQHHRRAPQWRFTNQYGSISD